MSRQIAFDTETTGIGHEQGHRIIEIGAVEMIDRKITGTTFHTYLNPQRAVDPGAFKVHGISNEFLQDKPSFKDIIHDLIQFIDGAELIIHNAPFDVGFLNAELKSIQWKSTLEGHCVIFDTLVLAREKYPGQRNNLDALCKRHDIDNSNRSLHGALLDAEILARLYLAMTSGQADLFVEEEVIIKESNNRYEKETPLNNTSPVIFADEQELKRHHAFLEFLKQ